MNYYTDTISVTLAEKLKEKGMPIKIARQTFAIDGRYEYDTATTYAEVFDWLLERRFLVSIVRSKSKWDWWLSLTTDESSYENSVELEIEPYDTWHEAANAATKKALTLI